jgi:hypothetical protein
MSEDQTQQKSEAHEKAQETKKAYKGEPIPGGPTDPEAPELAGEQRKREKQEREADD